MRTLILNDRFNICFILFEIFKHSIFHQFYSMHFAVMNPLVTFLMKYNGSWSHHHYHVTNILIQKTPIVHCHIVTKKYCASFGCLILITDKDYNKSVKKIAQFFVRDILQLFIPYKYKTLRSFIWIFLRPSSFIVIALQDLFGL